MHPVAVPGARILLREFAVPDSDALFEVYGDVRATEYLSFEPRTRGQVRALVERIVLDAGARPRTEYALAVVERAPGRAGEPVIGIARLAVGAFSSGQIGFGLRPDRWRQGLGAETVELLCGFGFEQLRLHRIWGARAPGNHASERVMESLGMRVEGRIRDHVQVHGRWRDSVVHSVLADEWAGRRAARPDGLGIPRQAADG